MINLNLKNLVLSLSLKESTLLRLRAYFERRFLIILVVVLSVVSVFTFLFYLNNGLGLAYNDARSHLDIARRVVENLKPGFAQLGSVWLPLPHFLMVFTVWNDFMWHSGLAGALQSMASFVAASSLIFLFMKRLKIGWLGILTGLTVFSLNLNVLYLQSTAMTELLLIVTMMAAVYELLVWYIEDDLYRLIKSAFWIMLSTMIRYDGWFLFFYTAILIFLRIILKKGYKNAEGVLVLFCTLAGFGIFIWLLWNQLIFKDMLYFVTGPYSAGTQQLQLAAAGALPTKHNLQLSVATYLYAMVFNSSFYLVLLSAVGAILFFSDKKISLEIKLAASALFAPLLFNVLALYFGQSALYVRNLNGSWFNVRYGLMMIPTIAIFTGYFFHRMRRLRWIFLGLFVLVIFFTSVNRDIVTLDDALIGASGKNVKEVSGWLKQNAAPRQGFVLISVASHDAIIFSSGMEMSRFIHEGTGAYWENAIAHPSLWARWIIMRTHDTNDMTYAKLQHNEELKRYKLIHRYPFADIYELRPQYVPGLHVSPVSFTGNNN